MLYLVTPFLETLFTTEFQKFGQVNLVLNEVETHSGGTRVSVGKRVGTPYCFLFSHNSHDYVLSTDGRSFTDFCFVLRIIRYHLRRFHLFTRHHMFTNNKYESQVKRVKRKTPTTMKGSKQLRSLYVNNRYEVIQVTIQDLMLKLTLSVLRTV